MHRSALGHVGRVRGQQVDGPDLVALGHAIACLRQDRGWSIDTLADASGVGRRTIMNIESAAKVPRIDTLYAVAHALDTPLTQLVERL